MAATNTLSLSERYFECIQLFQDVLFTVQEEDCEVVICQKVSLSTLLEEFGRFQIWGDQTKVELPARARGSLDDMLRHDSELRQVVHDILARLANIIHQAKEIARRKQAPDAESDQDSDSSVIAESDSDSEDERNCAHQRVPKICLLVQQIKEQIRSLYDLSSLLRRPTVKGEYIRSSNLHLNQTSSGSLDNDPADLNFRILDENYVKEKMAQWHRDAKEATSNSIPLDQRPSIEKYEGANWFHQRLVEANGRRREQFRFWKYQSVVSIDQVQTLSGHGKQEPHDQTHTLSQSGPPEKDILWTPTVPQPHVHDLSTENRPYTICESSITGQSHSNSVPDLPKSAKTDDVFQCPYCGIILLSTDMQKWELWKRHVFDDLRPYVCTFESCQNAGKLYTSRHDWFHHELQIHRRTQRCRACGKSCKDRNSMSEHLREHYGKGIPPSRLNTLLDLCDRPIDASDHTGDHCIFCGKELTVHVMQSHLGTHMESLALFVLPDVDDTDTDEGSVSRNSMEIEPLDSTGELREERPQECSLDIPSSGGLGIDVSQLTEPFPVEEFDPVLKLATQSIDENDQDPMDIDETLEHEKDSNMSNDTATRREGSQDSIKMDITSELHKPRLSSSSGCGATPSFVFRIEEIAEHPQIQSRTECRSWKPPINPHWSYSRGSGASDLFWHCNGQQIACYSQLPQGCQLFKKYSMYYSEGMGFWVLRGDGRDPPHDDDWHKLSFDTYDNRCISYLTISGQLSTLRVQPFHSPEWANMLLPGIYHTRAPATSQQPGGLVGELPIFLALAAFTTSPEKLRAVLPYIYTNGRWKVHLWQEPRTHKRGVVVTVYTYNSTKTDLKRYEQGAYGQYF